MLISNLGGFNWNNVFGRKYRILTLFQSLFNEVKDRGPSIEDVNTLGGRYISEAKVSRFI